MLFSEVNGPTFTNFLTHRYQGLVRFTSKSSDSILIGEPVDQQVDVGAETRAGKDVEIKVFSGTSILNPGSATGKTEKIDRVLSPLAESEVGTIRCIGLNVNATASEDKIENLMAKQYAQHAKEAKMALPSIPTLFMKPSSSLANPYPQTTIIPTSTLEDDCCDYESELVIIIGKRCKDVSEDEALDYVLGYTASNDVSSRNAQFAQESVEL